MHRLQSSVPTPDLPPIPASLRSRLHRSATAWSLVGALALLSGPADAAGPIVPGQATIELTTNQYPPRAATVTFDHLLATSLRLHLTDVVDGTIEIYDLSKSNEVRVKEGCKLEVKAHEVTLDKATAAAGNPLCRTLLYAAANAEYALSVSGSVPYGLLKVQMPEPYKGASADVAPKKEKAEGPALVWPWEIPSHVKLASDTCHLHIGAWTPVTCKGGRIAPPDDVKAALEARMAAVPADPPVLVASVIDASGPSPAWRKIPVKAAETPTVTPPTPPDLDLAASCKARLLHEAPRNAAGKPSPTEESYGICVDFRDARKPEAITLLLQKDGEVITARAHHLFVRRAIVVYVWHDTALDSFIGMDGAGGFAPPLYIPEGAPGYKERAAVAGGPPPPPVGVVPPTARRPFSPRAGETSTLTVTLKKAAEEKGKLELTYTIENIYRYAIRFGLGLGWSPWAREVNVRTGADGTSKYSAITGGDADWSGLFAPEIVSGGSIFVSCAMPELETRVCFALGFGIGLLKQASSGIDLLTSVRVGPELAIGRDFSLALTAGIHRHDVPEPGFEPGRRLPAATTKIETNIDITPGFGLVLNYTPSFFRGLGITGGS